MQLHACRKIGKTIQRMLIYILGYRRTLSRMIDRSDFMRLIIAFTRWAQEEERPLTRKFLITAKCQKRLHRFDNRSYPGARRVQMVNEVHSDLIWFNLESYVKYEIMLLLFKLIVIKISLIFCLEEENGTFLRKVCKLLPGYTPEHPRRQLSL
jgi:hypothetical protein